MSIITISFANSFRSWKCVFFCYLTIKPGDLGQKQTVHSLLEIRNMPDLVKEDIRLCLRHKAGFNVAVESPVVPKLLMANILEVDADIRIREILDIIGRRDGRASTPDPAEVVERAVAHGPAAPEQADHKLWKSNYQLNPEVNEYGNGEAEIIDFALIDEYGNYTNCIQKGTAFEIKSKVLFHTDITDPIFTYTFKTVQGTAVTGTNTMFEKVGIGMAKAGEVYVATFRQQMDLQGGEYLLSISCTGYVGGEFRAYHRLYDVVGVSVVSDKNTVGFYDMNSETTIEKAE